MKELNRLKMKEMFSPHLQSKSTLSNHSTAFGSRSFIPGCTSTLRFPWQWNRLMRILPAPVLNWLFPCSKGVYGSLLMQFNFFPSSAKLIKESLHPPLLPTTPCLALRFTILLLVLIQMALGSKPECRKPARWLQWLLCKRVVRL